MVMRLLNMWPQVINLSFALILLIKVVHSTLLIDICKCKCNNAGHLYMKSDVYAFGVVLIEILTALRALDPNRPSGQHNLTDWVKPYLQDRRKLKRIMDSSLEGKYPSKAAFRIAQLALKCLASEPKHRPSMNEMLESLERIEAASERPVESRFRSTHSTLANASHQAVHHRSPLHHPKHQVRV